MPHGANSWRPLALTKTGAREGGKVEGGLGLQLACEPRVEEATFQTLIRDMRTCVTPINTHRLEICQL